MVTRIFTLYKTSFKGLSKETWLLSFIMLVNRSGTMVLPFMTLYLTSKEMQHSLSDAGKVMGLFGLGAILGAFFGGKFSDKIGFYKVQLITLFFGGILFITLGQIKSYPLICVFTFLLSFVNEGFRPANSSAVAFYSVPENRTRSYSLNRLSVNLGWAIGAALGGLIAAYNYELLFWIDGISNILAALLLFFLLKPTGVNLSETTKIPELVIPKSAYKDKTYLWFIVLVMLFGFCFFQLFTTVPKYFRDNLLLSEKYIGFIMGLNGIIIVAIEMVLIYILEQKNKNMFYIRIGIILCACAFFSLLLPGNGKTITLIMILFITIGEIMTMPFMTSFWIKRTNENNRGQYAAIFTIAWGTGQTLGPYLCSKLVEQTNFQVLFIVLGSILLLTAFCFSRLKSN